jgi:hypothetical protein
MTNSPHMTPDIAQAIEIELRFLVPDWQIEQMKDEVRAHAPQMYRGDHAGFAREVARIADFISYKDSRYIQKMSAENFRITSSMADGSGFVVTVSVQ